MNSNSNGISRESKYFSLILFTLAFILAYAIQMQSAASVRLHGLCLSWPSAVESQTAGSLGERWCASYRRTGFDLGSSCSPRAWLARFVGRMTVNLVPFDWLSISVDRQSWSA